MCGGVHDVITGNKFHQNRLRGFRVTGVQKSGTPIDLACRPYNSSALPCWLWLRNFCNLLWSKVSLRYRKTSFLQLMLLIVYILGRLELSGHDIGHVLHVHTRHVECGQCYKYCQIFVMGGPHMHITNPTWHMAAVLKNQRITYLSNGLTDECKILHNDTHWSCEFDAFWPSLPCRL